MSRKRLVWQLFPSYVLVVIVSLLSVMWFANRSFRQFYLDNTTKDLESRTRLASQQIRSHLDPLDQRQVQALCVLLGRESGSRVTAIDPSGTVLGDSHKDPGTMESHADRPEIIEAFGGGLGVSTRYSSTLNTRMMYVALSVVESGRTLAVVRTALPITAIDEALRSIYGRIAVGGFVVALLVGIVSLLIARRIARPLEKLKMGADRFAEGDLESPLEVSDSGEIGSLAEAMNKMARQLNERIHTIVQQKNQEEAVLESMVESVLAVDETGRLLSVNRSAADMFGIDIASAKEQPVQEVLRHHQLHELVSDTLSSDDAVEDEIVVYDPDERYLQVHGTGLRGPGGVKIGALLVLNDVTRLRRLEKVRRDFVANVSHELRTPITTIKGFVETLLGGALKNHEDAERFLNIVANHTERLNAIISDLLSLSKIESQEEALELERTPLQNILKQAVDACRATARAREVKLKLQGEEIELRINGPLIEQAVVNLVDNAIKYSDHGSEVRVIVDRASNQSVAIRVEDDGAGIEKHHLPRLFERFYRTDKARSRTMGGTGLGLAIVKHIALTHGGRVVVQSEPGRGSTFSIVLPA